MALGRTERKNTETGKFWADKLNTPYLRSKTQRPWLNKNKKQLERKRLPWLRVPTKVLDLLLARYLIKNKIFTRNQVLLRDHKNIYVILTARNVERGEAAVKQLKEEGYKDGKWRFIVTVVVEFQQLDISDLKGLPAVIEKILEKHKRIDILINNAVYISDPLTFAAPKITTSNVPDDHCIDVSSSGLLLILQSFKFNTLAPMKLIGLIAPVMKKNNYGRIVNVSSGLGNRLLHLISTLPRFAERNERRVYRLSPL